MRPETVPLLAAALRADCELGVDCTCAARAEQRLADGEDEQDIIASFYDLTTDRLTLLLLRPAPRESIPVMIARMRKFVHHPDFHVQGSDTRRAAALLSAALMQALARLDPATLVSDAFAGKESPQLDDVGRFVIETSHTVLT